MSRSDDLVATIEAVHAAGLDAKLWPDALAALARIVGGAAATLEVFDKESFRHLEMHSFGLPPASEIEYLTHYAALNPRLPFVSRQKAGMLVWDYQVFDEPMLQRDSFYAEFMPRTGVRYFVGGMLDTSPQEFAGIIVHRQAKQGHVERAGIATMRRLMPHIRQAFDVARRLKGAGEARHSLERVLDWLADGVMLLRADGTVAYANEAMQAIARRGDGISVKKGRIEFVAADARTRLDKAIAGMLHVRKGDISAGCDFPVARMAGTPPYLVSMRPLVAKDNGRHAGTKAVAIVFVRDPLSRHAGTTRVLREVFGLTAAEASLAEALQAGVPLGGYAQDRAVSLNTVYTHLRRIKEKTGCRRMAELIQKLNYLQVPLRLE